MLCQNCGHFVKCPSCEGFVCPACGFDLLESVQFDPVQAQTSMKNVAAGHPA